MASRTFFLMFEVEDGGVSKPVKWSKESLKSENIVMVLDEENMAVWLWFGSKRGLVSKRTALRQAQSLKGHGYEIGKSIVGRGLELIHEIDERKIGRDPETDELNTKFMELLSKTMHEAGGFVVTTLAGGEPLPIEEHFEVPKPIEMEVIQPKAPEPAINPVPSPGPASINPVPSPAPTTPAPESLKPSPERTLQGSGVTPLTYDSVEIESKDGGGKMEETMSFDTQKVEFKEEGEYDEVTDVPEPEPAPVVRISGAMESVQKGCVIIAILSQFKDIWVSRVDENTVSVEYMDGPIAKFHIEEGKVKFQDGSFNDVEPAIKDAIKAKFNELIDAMK